MNIKFGGYKGNIIDDLRGLGYHADGQDLKTKEWRFYKSLSNSLFPRFHIYAALDKSSGVVNFNLHLDQKAPVYEGSVAHGGDYEGPVIEKETTRIKAQFAGKNFPLPRPID